MLQGMGGIGATGPSAGSGLRVYSNRESSLVTGRKRGYKRPRVTRERRVTSPGQRRNCGPEPAPLACPGWLDLASVAAPAAAPLSPVDLTAMVQRLEAAAAPAGGCLAKTHSI
jgi:hypothetical protein